MQTETQTDTTRATDERAQIIAALYRWIKQRPGLDPRNYGTSWQAYRHESRSITRDLNQARVLLRAVEWRSSIDAEALKSALKHSYSGRLSWNGESLDYCTGQYWPTEFRRAVCAVLASALWDYARESGQDKIGKGSPGDNLRTWARKEFGRAIGGRWFN